ncbi:thioredoxin [Candidatus Woesearchaeota archaeon]|jgi:thioredoxin 1|nr:thioredoxin [Candidatus Woesearchaeota archaeon]
MIYLNEENFDKEVNQSKIPVIIDFYADWCMPCRMMAPIFEKLSKEYEGKMKFCKLNTEENQGLSMQFDIQAIPALVIMHKGKEFDRIIGYNNESALKQKIDKIIKSV